MLPAGTAVTMGQRVNLGYGATSYNVVLGDGKSGYIADEEFLDMDDERSQKRQFAEIPHCARTGRITIGMTREQVSMCWGEPRREVRTDSKSGIRERLVYGSGTVFMLNGVVERVRTLE